MHSNKGTSAKPDVPFEDNTFVETFLLKISVSLSSAWLFIAIQMIGPECGMTKGNGKVISGMENVVSEQTSCPTSKQRDERESTEDSVHGTLTLTQSSQSSSEETIDDDPCQICLEPFRMGEEITWSNVSNCSHAFHHDCIVEWLQHHDDCPSCRAKYLSVCARKVNGRAR